jgi:putative hydrolase of the HAD superfamily
MAIKVITIDFWNTLFDSKNGMERNLYRNKILRDHFGEMGLSFPDDVYEKAMKDSWEYFNNIWQKEKRTPLSGELVEFYFSKMGVKPDIERIDNISFLFEESILKFKPALLPGVKENLTILKNKYDLAIISDTGFSPGKVLRVLLHHSEIIDFFSAFSFSDETGVSKPHKKAFQLILDHFDCKPEEVVHIGDIEQTDVLGAKQMGMQAIRFAGDKTSFFFKKNPEKTIADAQAASWFEIPKIIEEMNKLN